MKDLLEDSVDEKYYINNEKAKKLIEQLIVDGGLENEKKPSGTEGGGIDSSVTGQMRGRKVRVNQRRENKGRE